ncbi:type II toxin-antitoxin system prevent-host-death family antitoxin [Candidatus Collierbacteria bacterium]|nr:type II toxin-antitoxin system prevent-host-death family antitoxin [Candidatus Collierbacteria bacterium]
MNSTYTASDARNEFSEILSAVLFRGETVTIERHGRPIAKVIPVKGESGKKDVVGMVKKYFGVWKGEKWAAVIGKPSRYFRSRSLTDEIVN